MGGRRGGGLGARMLGDPALEDGDYLRVEGAPFTVRDLAQGVSEFFREAQGRECVVSDRGSRHVARLAKSPLTGSGFGSILTMC